MTGRTIRLGISGVTQMAETGIPMTALSRLKGYVSSNPKKTFEVSGYVKWYDPDKEMGFITTNTDGPDIVFYAESLRKLGLSSVKDKSLIRVMAVRTNQGVKAKNIISIDESTGIAKNFRGEGLSQTLNTQWEIYWVKSYDEKKGFGFLTEHKNRPDIFVHKSAFKKHGLQTLTRGERVFAICGQGPNGIQASEVRIAGEDE